MTVAHNAWKPKNDFAFCKEAAKIIGYVVTRIHNNSSIFILAKYERKKQEAAHNVSWMKKQKDFHFPQKKNKKNRRRANYFCSFFSLSQSFLFVYSTFYYFILLGPFFIVVQCPRILLVAFFSSRVRLLSLEVWLSWEEFSDWTL